MSMKTARPTGPVSGRGLPAISQKIAVSVVYVAALFLSTMDSTIVNVTLPAIGRAFSVPTASVGTVSISYLVALAVFIPASGWAGDRFGGKRVLLTAVLVFTAASALCGLASNLPQLIAFRILQGAGGGLLAPVGMAMLLRIFRPEERVRAFSVLTIATGIAPTAGPVIGGLLVTRFSWRSVFYVNVPIGICMLVFGILFLRNEVQEEPGRFDVAGFLLAAAGLGLAMYGVSVGPVQGWATAPVVASILSGVVLLTLMVAVELRTAAPIIDVRLLHDRLFHSCSGVMALVSVTFLGSLYTISLYFQAARGFSALAAGLSIWPETFGVMNGSQLGSRVLYRRLGPRRHLIAGMAGTSLFTGMLATLGAQSPTWYGWLIMYLAGFSVGQVFVATQAAAFATISKAETGRAATMFNAGRRLGGAIGVAVAMTTIVLVNGDSATSGGGRLSIAACRAAFLVSAAISLAGILIAWSVTDADAASTIPAPRPRKRMKTASERPLS
jgi:EmrB/QacA subfamily drug resistance transporter